MCNVPVGATVPNSNFDAGIVLDHQLANRLYAVLRFRMVANEQPFMCAVRRLIVKAFFLEDRCGLTAYLTA
jgi:hypothetical protein